jgi:hypothetical protein
MMPSDDKPTSDQNRFATLCARINAALDLEEYIRSLNYFPDKALLSGGVWRLLCPVHQEQVFRTLIINPRRNTCFCEHVNCGFHTHGDLIELLVKTRRLTRAMVVVSLLDHFGAEKLRLTEEQETFLRNYYMKQM